MCPGKGAFVQPKCVLRAPKRTPILVLKQGHDPQTDPLVDRLLETGVGVVGHPLYPLLRAAECRATGNRYIQ